MRVSERDYVVAVDELVQWCRTSRWASAIVSLYLAGSVARGDFSPGRSDIDVYAVAEDEQAGPLENELKSAANRIAAHHLADLFTVHEEPIGISVTTTEEIAVGRSFLGAGFEYHNFVSTARLLLGSEVRHLLPTPSPEAQRNDARAALDHAARMAAESVPDIGSLNAGEKARLTHGAFSLIFRAACIALCGVGRYVSGKQEAVRAFGETFPAEKELVHILKRSFELWAEWGQRDLGDDTLHALIPMAQRFIARLCVVWDACSP